MHTPRGSALLAAESASCWLPFRGKELLLSFRVVGAEGGMNIGARHSALTAVREHELAAVGQQVHLPRERNIAVVLGWF